MVHTPFFCRFTVPSLPASPEKVIQPVVQSLFPKERRPGTAWGPAVPSREKEKNAANRAFTRSAAALFSGSRSLFNRSHSTAVSSVSAGPSPFSRLWERLISSSSHRRYRAASPLPGSADRTKLTRPSRDAV